jgi:hypothetical protein
MMAVLQKGDTFKLVDECTDCCIAFIEDNSNDYYERCGEHKGMPLFICKEQLNE